MACGYRVVHAFVKETLQWQQPTSLGFGVNLFVMVAQEQ